MRSSQQAGLPGKLEREQDQGAISTQSVGLLHTIRSSWVIRSRADRRLQSLQVPFMLHTGNLERQDELVTRLGAPILAKPAFSDTIVQVVRNLHRTTDANEYSN